MKTWHPFEIEECDICGSDVEIFTDCPIDGVTFGHDGDIIRCRLCGSEGHLVVEEDCSFWVDWEGE